MKTKTLHQTVKFKASPTQVYEMLMDSRKHRSLSGMPAKISRKVGGKFTAWGTHILASTLLFCRAAKLFKHGEPLVGGRITTRLRSLTSKKCQAARALSSLRSEFLRTAIVVTIAAGSKPIGHQCRKYLSMEKLATRHAAEFGKVEISESKQESSEGKYL